MDETLRNDVLSFALSETQPGVKGLPRLSASADQDKVLLRLYTAHQVLVALGFPEDRVNQCIREGLGDGEGWVEGVEWVRLVTIKADRQMWLHLSEEECQQIGKEVGETSSCLLSTNT
jgi:ATP-dependent RNA helicase DHX29